MDHNKSHITPEFEDHGWAEMKKLLDLEMPVVPQRRRRPVFWWWALAGAGIALVLGSLWLYQQKSDNKVQPDPKPAVAQSESQKRSSSEAIKPAETATIIKEITVKKPSPESDPRSLQFRNVVVAPEAIPASLEQSAEVLAPVVGKPNVDLAVEQVAAPVAKRLAGLDKLPLLSLSDFDTFDKPHLSVPVKSFKVKEMPGLSMFISGLASFDSQTEGISTGLLLHYPKRESLIRLEAGLAYTFQRQHLSILVPTRAGYVGPVTSKTAGTAILSFEDLHSQANSLNRNYLLANQDLGLHYLDIPVGLSVKLIKNLRTFAGLNTGILLFSSPDYTRGSLFSFNTSDFSLDADPMEKSGVAASSFSVQLTSINLSLFAGLHYQLSTRAGVRVSYRNGLNDLLQSNMGSDKVRLWQLTATYRLQ